MSLASDSAPAARLPWKSLLGSSWLRPLNDLTAVDDFLGLMRPTWSLSSIKARVVETIRETASVRTLVLKPNHLWPGHRTGQHLTVEVELNGRRLRRTFSISSPPRPDGLIHITVQRREGGLVSAWWNDTAAVGDVVTLGEPSGEFTLPSPMPKRLVMMSAGSGITPVMAMLRELVAGDSGIEILFVHSARSREELIFGDELEALARLQPRLRVRTHFSRQQGRLSAAGLSRWAKECGDAPTFVCGPEGFMDAVRGAWKKAGFESALRFEAFGLPTRDVVAGDAATVHAARAGRTFVAAGGQSLLAAAEAAGLRPAHGCRVGICHTCKCRKVSGVVEDLRDGRRSAETGEMIQLCVMTAVSAVTLEL